MSSYKVLNKQIISEGNYSIVPIRFEDRLDIMKWRNEQIYHLRQDRPLTIEDQENYFQNVVSKLFEQEKPNQILFSYLEGEKCIGYGGLVHINWIDKNAEISFIMNTELEKDYFEFHWTTYLKLIEKIAFDDLNLHKIYTYAFDLRPRLYPAIEEAGFKKEARLKEHCVWNNGYKDVLIHSKINNLKLRLARLEDRDKTFEWARNPEIRKFSFNQNPIQKEEHFNWFEHKLKDENSYYYIMENSLGTALGSIRLDFENNVAIISYLIDSNFFGKGLGTKILKLVEEELKILNTSNVQLVGFVQKENSASIKIFNKLGYEMKEDRDTIKFSKDLR